MEEFHKVRRLPPYVFEQVNRLKASARAGGADIIDLGMGNPDLPTPQAIVDKLCETARDPKAGPVPDEKKPSTFDKPQKINLNVTVTGVIESEQADYYLVECKKGQRLTAEIEGLRLGETMFDPYVAILDSNSNPQGIAFPVPGNDDASRAIRLYTDAVAQAVGEGRTGNAQARGQDIGEMAEPPVEPALEA